MVERGDCSIKDVDNAMRLGAGHVIGPIALADMVGLDVLKMILMDGVRDTHVSNYQAE